MIRPSTQGQQLHTDHFVSDADWLSLAEFIAANPSLSEALGISDDPHTGAPGTDQMIEFLGGRLNVWPERFRENFATENVRFSAPLTIGAHEGSALL